MPPQPQKRLPYFDLLLQRLAEGDPEIVAAFGRHVHWGYWEDPQRAGGTAADLGQAAERLSQLVYHGAQVKNGAQVLDVGCGFGGTIASLNDHLSQATLIGLNIDERQLERARQQVQPKQQNRISFVEGNAGRLPFPDASFDAVLAVECIFHFPSRIDFFTEARRVLKPGGRLALSDFIPNAAALPFLNRLHLGNRSTGTLGDCQVDYPLSRYRCLARQTSFRPIIEHDITANTIPTYPVVRALSRHFSDSRGSSTNTLPLTLLEWISRLKLLRYMILAFEKT